MKLFTNKYSQTQTWIEAMQLREAKKQVLVSFSPETTIVDNQGQVNNSQVVFTKEDSGHNTEESQKIQKLYVELGGQSWVPLVAMR